MADTTAAQSGSSANTARYSILQRASGAYRLARIGSHREATLEQSDYRSAFDGSQDECFAHIAANRQQFPATLLNAEG